MFAGRLFKRLISLAASSSCVNPKLLTFSNCPFADWLSCSSEHQQQQKC